MLLFKRVGPFVGMLLLVAATALAGDDLTLTILHTNDIHAHLAAFDEFGAFCDKAKDAAGKCQGGAARLATAVARQRAKGGNILLLRKNTGIAFFFGTQFGSHAHCLPHVCTRSHHPRRTKRHV